jgi:hypothetical protein
MPVYMYISAPHNTGTSMVQPVDWHAIIPYSVDSPISLYFDIRDGNLDGEPLPPDTTLCGYAAQWGTIPIEATSVSTASTHLHIIIPCQFVPPSYNIPLLCFLVKEIPQNLQYIGYVITRVSTNASFSHRPMYVNNHLNTA